MWQPDVAAWQERSRLNRLRGMSDHMSDPTMQSAMARWAASMEPAIRNAERLLTSEAGSSTNDRSLVAWR